MCIFVNVFVCVCVGAQVCMSVNVCECVFTDVFVYVRVCVIAHALTSVNVPVHKSGGSKSFAFKHAET